MTEKTRKHKSKTHCKTRKRVPFTPGVDFLKDTRVLMLYISAQRYLHPTIIKARKHLTYTPMEILNDVNSFLHDEHYMYGLKLREYADCEKLPSISMNQVKDILHKAFTKKYQTRPSPPFSAGPLCGYIMEGNDGKSYKSVKVGASCVWKQIPESIPYL